MNAALILMASLLAGQVQPGSVKPPPTRQPSTPERTVGPEVQPTQPTPAKVVEAKEAPEKEDPEKEADEEKKHPVFTLDQLAAGAKNDAFVDEFLKDRTLKLYGKIMQIERMTVQDGRPTGDGRATGAEKAEAGYRVLMGRVGHEDRAVDVEVAFFFPAAARKELAMLDPGTTKITIEGTCAATQLQSLVNGVGFMLAIKDCKIVETPAGLAGSSVPPRTSVLPLITPPTVPVPTVPEGSGLPRLDTPGVPPLPPLPPTPQAQPRILPPTP
jgi:hypothetical protein